MSLSAIDTHLPKLSATDPTPSGISKLLKDSSACPEMWVSGNAHVAGRNSAFTLNRQPRADHHPDDWLTWLAHCRFGT